MNRAEFHDILQNPKNISSADVEGIQAIIETYPYFQPARALYLKALKEKESFKYNQELKVTAAYTTDRSILFDFITSEDFLQNEISKIIKINAINVKDIEVEAIDISVNKKVSIDEILKKQIEDTEGVLDPELFQPKINKYRITGSGPRSSGNDKDYPPDDEEDGPRRRHQWPQRILNIGKPLEFEPAERHSFNEWLQLTTFKPIDRTKEVTSEEDVSYQAETSNDFERKRKFDMIDKFISNNPKIQPEKSLGKNKNLAEENLIQPEALMTETLARIYVEQKNYKKALQSYKILSLKYPEKSGFFADQIKAIEKLQE